VEEIDYWLRMLSAPRPSAEGSEGDAGPKPLPPPLEPPQDKRAEKSKGARRQPEVDGVDYWLREMNRKRPTDE